MESKRRRLATPLNVLSQQLGDLQWGRVSENNGGSKVHPLLKNVFKRHGQVTGLIRMALAESQPLSTGARLLLRKRFAIDLAENVHIGPRFFLPHPNGIVIGNGARLGSNVVLGQGSTIGGNFKKEIDDGQIRHKLPRIGDWVWISAGAVVAGPVRIGNHVIVGANAVVTSDVPSNHIVVGRNQVLSRPIRITGLGQYEEI